MSSRNLFGVKMACKSRLPPLRGLFVAGTRVVANLSWDEIERNNLGEFGLFCKGMILRLGLLTSYSILFIA